ncbi:SMP-30/gluconolactonase/LRE family protein [Algibacter sp. L1A34]|uniref:SMP-30/gluconolactonase/LRE family protein n=1 Tax=Algibacter sp. L1A34 TaxID=2686365 RepID=UPI00131AD4FB|nr:SMP-30/gluconolactonase/LRE family protein [Algibacter sp. L1A34]
MKESKFIKMKVKEKLLKTFLAFINIILVFVLCTSCNAQKKQSNQIIEKGAELVLISDDYEFTEGPAADKEGNVYFTDQPNDRILKWNAKTNLVSEYMKPSGRSNGLYFDNDGNLLSAADEKNELWLINPNKEITVLVDNYDGKKLNGPNDLWVDAKGGVYFTDPYYQRPWWEHKEPQQNEKRVYYLASNTNIPRIVSNDNYVQPNGIIGTPDGKTLYVADQVGERTYVFTIDENGNLTNRKLFVDMGSDGMTIDNLGNIYLTGKGVTVFNSEGKKIKHIDVPEGWTANVTFGGLNKNILFITAMDSIYTLKMNVTGVN